MNITGKVYRLAGGSTASPRNLGNVHVGGALSGSLSVTNSAANDGYSERLNAGITGTGGDVNSASGSISLLAAQQTDSSSVNVGLDAATAGAKSGTVTLAYQSDGTGTSGFTPVANGSQTVTVTGGVYRLAQASVNPSPVVIANQRLGGGASQVLTIGNTAVNDGYSEALDAGVSAATGGVQTSGGPVTLLAAGDTSTAISVGVDTSSVGVKNGTVTLGLSSDGTGTSNLGTTALASQTINVTGTVYRLAQGSTAPVTVNFGNVHLGDASTQALTIQNVAANDGFSEKLDASFGATTAGATTNGGAVNLLAAGASDAIGMAVGLDTSSAGVKSGSVTVNYQSDGTGTSGLAAVAAGSQGVNVSGTVYRLAQANALSPIDFGNVHVGDTVSQALSIQNLAVNDSYSEKLDASFGASSDARILTSGSISLLGAGASDGSAMVVALDTSAAGTVNGTTTINFDSNGLGTSGLGITALPSQTIGVSSTIQANVYRLAEASQATPNPVDFGNMRVGDSASQVLSITNTAANDGASESLDGQIGVATGAATTNGGSFSLLAAQATDNSSLAVGLNTSTAGAKNGTATVTLQSDGQGTSGLGMTDLSSQVVTVSGNVYQVAQGQLNTAPLNFGTVQVGQSVSRSLSITNSATGPSGYVEDLNASFATASGQGAAQIQGSGTVNGLVAGGTDAGSMVVSVDTSAAGTINGGIGINYYTAGTVNGASNGLGAALVGSDNYGVSGVIAQVINQADPVINTGTINLGNVRVGDAAPTAFVSITNQATASPQAALDATITGNAPVTAGGSFNLLAPGGTDNTSLQVGMDTATAGHINGTATVSLLSDAANVGGCSPNCQMALASQDVTVTGNVYRLATGNTASPLNLGNVHVGGTLTGTLSVTNTATDDGYSEKLNAGITGTAGDVNAAAGSIGLLAAQQTDSSSLTVGLNAGAAGARSGTVTVAYQSDGAGTSGYAAIANGSQTVTVTGGVYNLAAGSAAPASVTIDAQRVGGTATAALTVTNTALSGAYTEGLDASFGTSAGDAIDNGGTVHLLAGGAGNNSNMQVGVETSTAGFKSGTVTLDYVSDGTGTSGLGTTDVGGQSIAVSGKVYQSAVAQINTPSVDFGIVHKGDVVSTTALSVNNAAGAALNDVLLATFGTVSSHFTASGDLAAGLAAGGTDSTHLIVGLDTSAAGVFNGTATVDFSSHNPDMADLNLASQDVSLTAQVNDYANAELQKVSGAGSFIGGGNSYTLDFGSLSLGSAAATIDLGVMNNVAGPADLLGGSFTLGGFFAYNGFNSFNGIAAGQSITGLEVVFDPATLGLGSFSSDVLLNPYGYNSTGYLADLSPIMLSIRGSVVASSPVPEPGTLWLAAGGLTGLGWARRRHRPSSIVRQ